MSVRVLRCRRKYAVLQIPLFSSIGAGVNSIFFILSVVALTMIPRSFVIIHRKCILIFYHKFYDAKWCAVRNAMPNFSPRPLAPRPYVCVLVCVRTNHLFLIRFTNIHRADYDWCIFRSFAHSIIAIILWPNRLLYGNRCNLLHSIPITINRKC